MEWLISLHPARNHEVRKEERSNPSEHSRFMHVKQTFKSTQAIQKICGSVASLTGAKVPNTRPEQYKDKG
jgi:hypothetical protein